jgi:hypothetical protein
MIGTRKTSGRSLMVSSAKTWGGRSPISGDSGRLKSRGPGGRARTDFSAAMQRYPARSRQGNSPVRHRNRGSSTRASDEARQEERPTMPSHELLPRSRTFGIATRSFPARRRGSPCPSIRAQLFQNYYRHASCPTAARCIDGVLHAVGRCLRRREARPLPRRLADPRWSIAGTSRTTVTGAPAGSVESAASKQSRVPDES